MFYYLNIFVAVMFLSTIITQYNLKSFKNKDELNQNKKKSFRSTAKVHLN